MNFLTGPRLVLALCVFAAVAVVALATGSKRDQYPFERAYLSFVGAPGTQHNRTRNSRKFYLTNSGVPITPRLGGFIGSHGTYRIMQVMGQTMLIVGEPKHGLWRIQESGYIREYRKDCLIGIRRRLANRLDINTDWSRLGANNRRIIRNNYRHWYPEDGPDGYIYPNQPYTQTNEKYLNFIDLSIHHPKYGNRYLGHPPIDLPIFYCLISQAKYPYLFETWKYVIAQPQANKIGPLGVRAGLDIRENYLNVIRFQQAPDSGVWANVGTGNNATDFKRCNPNDEPPQTINYERVDLSRIDHEIYVVERLLFNEPYMFVVLVMDGNDTNGDPMYTYIRNDGAYWASVVARGLNETYINNTYNHFPHVYVDNVTESLPVYGLPVYGHHHPNRSYFDLEGGACPAKGGDMGQYPWGNAGSGFPSNYEEITPLCDGVLLDIKGWANLDKNWEDPSLGLGNAGAGEYELDYTFHPNRYGYFTDPYLLENNFTNPYAVNWLTNWTDPYVDPDYESEKPSPITIQLSYDLIGTHLEYVQVPDIPPRGAWQPPLTEDAPPPESYREFGFSGNPTNQGYGIYTK